MSPVVAALLAHSVAALPYDDRTPTSHLALELGVPIPLSVYGYRSEDGSSGLEWLGSLGLEYRYRLSEGWGGRADFGGWLLAADIHGRDRAASADVYFVSLGVLGAIDVPTESGAYAPSILVAIGFGVMFNGIVVDRNLNLQTISLGGLARVRFQLPVSACYAVTISAGLELFSPPLNRDTWFNTPLHETVVTTLSLGITRSW